MVTGASTADVALVLIDARHGVVEQSKRHAFIASLLGVPAHRRLRQQDGPRRLGPAATSRRSPPTSPPSAAASGCPTWRPCRSPRSTATTSSSARTRRRGTTGRRCSSTSRRSTSPPTGACSAPPGCRCSGSSARTTTPTTTTAATPARWRAACCAPATRSWSSPRAPAHGSRASTRFDGPVEEAFPPMSVTVLLEDDLDVSRGDMLCAADAPAQVARDLRADVCWLDDAPAAAVGARYLIKHTTRTTRVELTRIEHRVEIESLRTEADPGALELNDIGRVTLRAARAAGARPLRRQPRHRQLHPDRRGDQRHRGGGHGRARRSPTPARAARTWCGSAARPRARTAGPRSASPAPPSGSPACRPPASRRSRPRSRRSSSAAATAPT